MEERRWHKHYAGGVSPTVQFEEICMAEVLTRNAQDYADLTALIFLDHKISYLELNQAANRFANALLDMGVKSGDRVALLLPNLPQTVVAYYGAWKIGAVVVPNNPLYTDEELKYQFNDSGSTVLVTIDLLAPRMKTLQKETGIEKVIVTSITDQLPGAQPSSVSTDDIIQWLDLQEKYSADDPNIKLNIEDLSVLIYTGGTTGVSKGVMLTNANLSKDVQIVSTWFPPEYEPGTVVVGAIPFFHAYGLTAGMNLCIIRQCTNVLIPRPDPPTLLEAIHKHRSQVLPAVPTMLVGMLNHPDLDQYDLTSLKACFPAAAPVPLDLINEFETLTGCQICGCYGLTETSPCATMNPLGGVSKAGSIGIPLPETDVKVVDLETGTEEVPIGEPGELIIKGPIVCKGYYNMPEETAKAIKDGWLYTGDIVTMDEDGYLYVVDRKKDMIIAGGYNIYPLEIDNVLFGHPKILEACTVGVPDDYRGETVKVFVVVRDGESMTEQEVIDYCRQRLAKYKVPRLVEFIDELPKGSVGKVLRRKLREMEIKRMEEQKIS